MKRVLVLQARMTSSRLPGKVLMDLAGRPMLRWQLERLRLCRNLDEIVVATTVNVSDDAVVELADASGVRWFRGSEHDVLGRYHGAAYEVEADVVVRATADCPLIDPSVVDQVVAELTDNARDYDYSSNVLERTYPRGLDVEAMFRDCLDRIERRATSAPAREHVTYFLTRERPDLFTVRSVTDTTDNSDLRWTVDTVEDLAMVRAVYRDFGDEITALPYLRLVEFVRGRADIRALNASVEQKTR